MKRYPTGTYSLLTSNDASLDPEVLNFDHIKGFRIRTDWMHFQPDLGDFTFDYIDDVIAEASNHHKHCGMGVAGGVFAPVELFEEEGAVKFDLAVITGKGGNYFMAFPWDEIFQRHWFEVIDTACERFDPNPVISYFVMSGFMQVFENHFSTDEEEMALADQAAKDAGFENFSEGYLASAEQIIERYVSAFPTTPLLITLGGIGPGQKQTEKTLLDWAKTTYPGHVGTMTAFHKATPPPHSPNTNPPLANPKGDQAVYASYDQERFYSETPPSPFPEAPQPIDDLLALP